MASSQPAAPNPVERPTSALQASAGASSPSLPPDLQAELFRGILGVMESVSAPNGAQDVLLVHLDPEGVIRYISPSIQHLAGYRVAEVMGQKWNDLFGLLAVDQSPYFDESSALLQKDVIITEMALPCRDGSERILTWRLYKHPSTHDHPGISLTLMGLDVTSQRARLAQAKEADRRLEERERLLSSLHGLSRQLGRSMNLQHVYRLIFREIAQRFLGSPHLVVALVSADRSHFVCDFAIVDKKEIDHTAFPLMPIGQGPTSDCYRTGKPQIVDIAAQRAKLPQGRIVNVGEDDQLPNSGLYVPLFAGDVIIGVMSVQRYEINAFDETDLDLLSVLAGMAGAAIQNALLYRKLQDQADQMQTIMNAVSHGLILIDRNWQVLLANPVAQKHLEILDGIAGDGRLTRLGTLSIESILDHSRREPSAPLDVVTESNPPEIFEIQSAAIGPQATPGGWVLVIRDVTAERQAQRYVQQQERLAAVGQLAAGIAHDFNNIMGAIVIYAQALQLQASDANARRRLDTIVSQANHAANLIRQILDFSRRSVMERTALDLVPFVKELVQLLQRTLPENIHLDLRYDRNTFVVDADITRIQQALMNLAVNARDAMPNGGNLTIHLRYVMVDEATLPPTPGLRGGAWLGVEVTDTGTGIPPDIVDHIFEPFFTTKDVGAGTGLGLAQVYGIVQQHGGEIQVESRLGEGTTFHLYFPLLDEPAQAAPTTRRGDHSLAPTQGAILVVEDESAMREALEDILTMKGYTVYQAANGADALKLLGATRNIDMLLTDLVMPVMGGQELSRAVLRMKPEMPILLMTGHPRQSLEWVQSEQERIHWIQKPFSADDVLDKVGELLAR